MLAAATTTAGVGRLGPIHVKIPTLYLLMLLP